MYQKLPGNPSGTRHGSTEVCAANVRADLSTDLLGLTDDSSFTVSFLVKVLPLLRQIASRGQKDEREMRGDRVVVSEKLHWRKQYIEIDWCHGDQCRLVLPATQWHIQRLPSLDVSISSSLAFVPLLLRFSVFHWCPLVLKFG